MQEMKSASLHEYFLQDDMSFRQSKIIEPFTFLYYRDEERLYCQGAVKMA